MSQTWKDRIKGWWSAAKLWTYKYVGGLVMEEKKDGHLAVSLGRVSFVVVLLWIMSFWGEWAAVATEAAGVGEAAKELNGPAIAAPAERIAPPILTLQLAKVDELVNVAAHGAGVLGPSSLPSSALRSSSVKGFDLPLGLPSAVEAAAASASRPDSFANHVSMSST